MDTHSLPRVALLSMVAGVQRVLGTPVTKPWSDVMLGQPLN
jgi:hypothetical protein